MAGCGGVAQTGAGGPDAGQAGMDAVATDAVIMDATADTTNQPDVVDASPMDVAEAGQPPNSACAPAQGVHAVAGSGQGATGCMSGDGGALALLVGYTSVTNPYSQIAVDTTNLYWAESDGVVKADKTGVPLTKYCTSGGVSALAIDDQRIYVSTTNGSPPHSILAVPKSGGDWTQIASSNGWPYQVTVDALNVYWAEADNPPGVSGTRILKVGKDGTGLQKITEQPSIYLAASDGTFVYWLAAAPSDTIFRGTTDGGQAVQLAQVPNRTPSGFAIDNQNVYWGESGTGAAVWKVGKDGTGAAQLASSTSPTYGILANGTHVYWIEDADTQGGSPWFSVHRMAPDGTGDQVILRQPTANTMGGHQITAEWVPDIIDDGTALYFASLLPMQPGPLYKFCE